MTRRPRVLMVTGAYYPEVSGGGLQCRGIVHSLRDRAAFAVLTTTTDARLPREDVVDGVTVYRMPVDVARTRSLLWAGMRLVWWFVRHRQTFEVVHVHGFSRKSLPLTVLAKGFRKKLYLTLQTGGHDEPGWVRAQGRVLFWCYRQADGFSGVSPGLQEAFCAAGLPADKFRLIPNGVDVERFWPVDPATKRRLRGELGLPTEEGPVVLFVGFFSREKRPDVAFEAWARLRDSGTSTGTIVFVGATRSPYHEVDETLAQAVRTRAQELGVAHRVRFVEQTLAIERYYQAADVFVLSSAREGCPIALLEAMATELPCIATRLPGSTEPLIEDGVNGLLVPPGDVGALASALQWVLAHPHQAQELGRRARQAVRERFSIARVAECYLQVYSSWQPAHRRPEPGVVP